MINGSKLYVEYIGKIYVNILQFWNCFRVSNVQYKNRTKEIFHT